MKKNSGSGKRNEAASAKTSTTRLSPADERTVVPHEARPLLVALGVFVLLRGVISLLHPDGQRLWGIDFPAWLGDGVLVQLALWLPLLFLLPPVARLFKRVDATEPKGPSTGRLVVAAALTAGAALVAWQVQVAYAFLGDGTWYAAELYRSITSETYANSMIKPSAWLTGIVLDGLARALRPDDIRLPFMLAGIAGMSIAAGAVFFSTLKERVSVQVAAALLLLAGCGSLVFFGYIELYALVYGLSIAYLVTAWQCIRGNAPVWLPAGLLVLAIVFGATAAAWLPSLLLLLHWKVRGEEGSFPLRHAAVVLMLLPLVAVAGLYLLTGTQSDSAYLVAFTAYERVVDGLRTGWQRYVFIAPERWMDLLNMLLLGLGPLLFVVPVLLVQARRSGMLRRPAVLFAATAATGGLTLLVFGNTFLGLARDWDVGAFALLGTALLGLALWTERIHAPRGWLHYVLPGLAAAMVSQFMLWISLNTSDQASAARFESIAEMDDGVLLPMNSFTAYENLRKFHQAGGDTQAYFRVLRRQIETGYRTHIGYAEYLSSLLKLNDVGLRSRELSWLLDSYLAAVTRDGEADDHRTIRRQDAREFAARLLLTAWQIGEHGSVARYEAAFRSAFESWPEIGLLDVLRVPTDPAADALRIATAVTPATKDPFLHMTAGGLYQQRGLLDSASAAYDAALEREPSLYPSWYLVAADLHRSLTGDTDKARELLERCIANAPASAEAAQARQLLVR